MITFERVVLVLILILIVVDLFVDLRAARPRRRRQLKDFFVDEGISLSERKGGPADLKLRNAVDWAEEQCRAHNLTVTRSELARMVEIRLPRAEKTKPAV